MRWLKRQKPQEPVEFGLKEQESESHYYLATGVLSTSRAFHHTLYARTFVRSRVSPDRLEQTISVARYIRENERRDSVIKAVDFLFLHNPPSVEIAFLAHPKVGKDRIICQTAIALPTSLDRRTLVKRIMRCVKLTAESLDHLDYRSLVLEDWFNQHYWQMAVTAAFVGRAKE